jgi:L-lysine exporter family protein LysE/ArgO
MISAFYTGFFLGLSLIIAIGAQNAFVLRQGITGQHIFYVALFCALSDALLIGIGVAGISFFLNNFVIQNSNWLFGISALWLAGYAIVRIISTFKSDKAIEIEISSSKDLFPTLISISILTFANPHVYLDTMFLIGSISQQFIGEKKLAFALGASLASFIFFFSLAYGAKLFAPIMTRPNSWRILNWFIGFVMLIIALNLAIEGNWV